MNDVMVEVSGSGSPVVMVHGLGGSTNVWEPQVRRLDSEHRFVRFDLPGSARSPAKGKLSIDGWVNTLASVMDAQELTSAAIAAHSLGTLIAQHFAARYPQRVTRLALLGINRAPVDARRQTLRDRADKVRREGMRGIAEGVMEAALSPRTKADKLEVVAFVREVLLAQDAEGYARSCEAVSESQPADLSRVDCPVLLVAGADDTVSPPAISEAVAKEFREARVEVLRECGHWLPLERAEDVSGLLRNFLHAELARR